MISFVVCTYNGESRLPATLRHLIAAIDHGPDEIVVIDNRSQDRTAAVAGTFAADAAANGVELRIIREEQPGLGHARRAGVLAARGDAICFVDDDNHLDPGFATVLRQRIAAAGRVYLIGAHGRPLLESTPPEWFPTHAWAYAVGPQKPVGGPLTTYYGAGLTFDAATLRGLFAAGFDPVLVGRTGGVQFAGDDGELCLAALALGAQPVADDRLGFLHVLPPERVTESRLTAMLRGFGAAHCILDRYRCRLPHLSAWMRLACHAQGWAARRRARGSVRPPRTLHDHLDVAFRTGYAEAMAQEPVLVPRIRANLRVLDTLRGKLHHGTRP